ncbi:MAG: N-acetyltransferase [Pyrinomonadaceae bacterium]|jgi:predicted N-acetyltransferase YhbS|nr:N-acetyltransferase [Pyrinomonadaceae bacterium]
MKVEIRQEKEADYQSVFNLIEEAFRPLEISDHREQFLVEKLRKSDAFVPELSLVAEVDNKIVGHILLTKIKIVNESKTFESLALAPLAVLPDYQNKGIGGKLINFAHKKAAEMGYKSVVVVGHPTYYPKFGYELTQKYGVELPFEVSVESSMIIALVENGLQGVCGKVEYAKEFFE